MFSGLIASGSDSDNDNAKEATNLLLSAASIDVKQSKAFKKTNVMEDGFDSEEVQKPARTKSKSKLKTKLVMKKKRKLAEMASNLPADLNDSRFGALYTSSDFAIDKTNPHYKGGALADRQVQEKIRRKK